MTAGTTLLAFDFDGTLAPIRPNPNEVRMERGAAALLGEASHIRGVSVAVLSGRDVADVAWRVNIPGAYIVGSHGLEIVAPGGVTIRDTPPLEVEPEAALLQEIEASGLRIERKKHAIALHWRGVPYPAIEPVVDGFRDWARRRRLDVIEGRCVVEARAPGGRKESALRWLAHAVGASRIVYAGDDITDFGPLRFASEHGAAVFMASDERPAPPDVIVAGSFRELLQIIREEVMIC
jgi:trehalose-phosphatase